MESASGSSESWANEKETTNDRTNITSEAVALDMEPGRGSVCFYSSLLL